MGYSIEGVRTIRGQGTTGVTKGDEMTEQGNIIVQVKRAAKEKYAWPGGYPLFIVLANGAALCTECAKKEIGLIAAATSQGYQDGWKVSGVDVNWEDTSLYCDHCSEPIESAYGEEQEA